MSNYIYIYRWERNDKNKPGEFTAAPGSEYYDGGLYINAIIIRCRRYGAEETITREHPTNERFSLLRSLSSPFYLTASISPLIGTFATARWFTDRAHCPSTLLLENNNIGVTA